VGSSPAAAVRRVRCSKLTRGTHFAGRPHRDLLSASIGVQALKIVTPPLCELTVSVPSPLDSLITQLQARCSCRPCSDISPPLRCTPSISIARSSELADVVEISLDGRSSRTKSRMLKRQGRVLAGAVRRATSGVRARADGSLGPGGIVGQNCGRSQGREYREYPRMHRVRLPLVVIGRRPGRAPPPKTRRGDAAQNAIAARAATMGPRADSARLARCEIVRGVDATLRRSSLALDDLVGIVRFCSANVHALEGYAAC
jgi:hypothetical protein